MDESTFMTTLCHRGVVIGTLFTLCWVFILGDVWRCWNQWHTDCDRSCNPSPNKWQFLKDTTTAEGIIPLCMHGITVVGLWIQCQVAISIECYWRGSIEAEMESTNGHARLASWWGSGDSRVCALPWIQCTSLNYNCYICLRRDENNNAIYSGW